MKSLTVKSDDRAAWQAWDSQHAWAGEELPLQKVHTEKDCFCFSDVHLAYFVNFQFHK